MSAAASGYVARAAGIALLWPIRAPALEICSEPNEPPLAQPRPGMNLTAMLTLANKGELLGEPRFADVTPEASHDTRALYEQAVGVAIDGLHAAAALGGARQRADGIAENRAVSLIGAIRKEPKNHERNDREYTDPRHH